MNGELTEHDKEILDHVLRSHDSSYVVKYVQSLIKRDKPVKPKIIKDYFRTIAVLCPSCERELMVWNEHEGLLQPFCGLCGQQIDFSTDNKEESK